MKTILDKRSIPSNERVGWVRADPKCDAPNLIEGKLSTVLDSYVNLLSAPNGNRIRQLVRGSKFRILEETAGVSFGFNAFDGYVGYVRSDNLKNNNNNLTHWVSSIATHIYAHPDIKKEYIMSLSFGSQLEIVDVIGDFCETSDGGYIPKKHLKEQHQFYSDPVMVAQMFLGVPYLWGGNTCWGIDCSGLIQAALCSCGINCRADSDQQEAMFTTIPNTEKFKRNDLMFWDDHVALVVNPSQLIHANAFHMSVTLESIKETRKRIQLKDGGEFRLCRVNVN